MYLPHPKKEKPRGKVEGREEEEKCARKSACHCERRETQRKSPTNLLDSLVAAAERLIHELSSQILVCITPCLQFWRLVFPFSSVYKIRIPLLPQEERYHYCGPGQCFETRDGCERLEKPISQNILGCMCVGKGAGQALLC